MSRSPLISLLLFSLLMGAILVLPTTASPPEETIEYPSSNSGAREDPQEIWIPVGNLSKQIEIPAGGRYVVKFDHSTGGLTQIDVPNITASLSQTQRDALAEVPLWLVRNLTRKFADLGTAGDQYANLILTATDARYKDEIAFAIAHTPVEYLSNHNYPEVFVENAKYIYQNDADLDYVDLVEHGSPGDPDHYTTTTYWVNRSYNRVQVTLPRDIYYWYIVHPRVSEERPTFINPNTGHEAAPPTGRLWREYLFNHNDNAYPPDPSPAHCYPKEESPPLLKGVLEDVDTLWNLTPYKAPRGYNNTGYNNTRPWGYGDHAIERISNWVEKTLPLNQQEVNDNERPTQPVRIAHHHNGNCGELQDLSVAAARSSLIPAVAVLGISQDHVWQEFFERGWNHWDNWWSDGGSGVAWPDIYDGNWFDVATIWAERGDDLTFWMTEHYTPTSELEVTVLDPNGAPVDGARVLLAANFKDTSNIMIDSWNSTGPDGVSSFTIGDNKDYWLRVDSPQCGSVPSAPNQVTTVISGSQIGLKYTHQVDLPTAKPHHAPQPSLAALPLDPWNIYRLNVTYMVDETTSKGQNYFTDNWYYRDLSAHPLSFFICDSDQFSTYGNGGDFSAFESSRSAEGDVSFNIPSEMDWYGVLSNEGRLVSSLHVTVSATLEKLLDVIPPVIDLDVDTTVNEDVPVIFDASGTTDNFGIASFAWDLDASDGIDWTDPDETGDTAVHTFTEPGTYNITLNVTDLSGNTATETVEITVLDVTPPQALIDALLLVDEDTPFILSGSNSTDNVNVSTYLWDLNDIDGLFWDAPDATGEMIEHIFWEPGSYTITLKVVDPSGMSDTESTSITVADITAPAAIFTVSDDPEEDDDIEFDAASSFDNVAIDEYLWDFDEGDGIESEDADEDGKDVEWEYDDPGDYIVTLWVSDTSGNWNMTNMTISVRDVTAPKASFQNLGPNTVDAGSIIDLSAARSFDNVAIVNHSWDFDSSDGLDWNEPDSKGVDVSWTYNESGTFTITLFVEDAAGNSDMDTIMIQVLAVEEPPEEIFDPGTEEDDTGGEKENETAITEGDDKEESNEQRTIALVIAMVIIIVTLVVLLFLTKMQKSTPPVYPPPEEPMYTQVQPDEEPMYAQVQPETPPTVQPQEWGPMDMQGAHEQIPFPASISTDTPTSTDELLPFQEGVQDLQLGTEEPMLLLRPSSGNIEDTSPESESALFHGQDGVDVQSPK